ncbi:OadG family protein [Aliidiomarina quisquiliarum]|uniref:OadG family protein n=1 Tax=Aliidiomarina quisquiliarum TaxID=2938947 RepID=UPI00208E5176|nr:OadG family transporter subunit [Aliidiomarina quisquiliarum]MCO4320130.1 OadG family protein [Aliidiomarina quisquiliarum]
MTSELLVKAFDVLVVGLIVVFLFLIVLTIFTKLLVALFPEQSSHTHSDISHKAQLKPQPLSKPQQAAIAVAVHRYRHQQKHEGKLL